MAPAGQQVAADDVTDVLRTYTGITLSHAEANAVARTLAGEKTDDLNPQHRGVIGALGQSLGNHTGIAWTGTAHTADLSPTVAIGPGAARLAGLMHHVDVHCVLLRLWDIEHGNPSMSSAKASRFLSTRGTDDFDAHWT
jgi:alkaline phosphatase